MRTLVCCLLLLCVSATSWVRGDERILSFHSTITVQPDGWLAVTEEITVRAEGREIKRGIFRDFPQTYANRGGMRMVREFEVLGVTRNGREETHRVERIQKGTRLWVGSPRITLPVGSEQVYRIEYRTNRQLLLEKDGDELYWNVTGNEWSFPIDEARATVHLPVGAEAFHRAAYTGARGARGRDYELDYREGVPVEFRTTRPLAVGEGLTVALRWQPGLLEAEAYETGSLWEQNFLWMLGACLVSAALAWQVLAWLLVGRDPKKGLVIPRWEPPAGFSPGAVRYLSQMKFDNLCFSAGVIGLAAKGLLRIENKRKIYTLHRKSENQEGLTKDETLLFTGVLGSRKLLSLRTANRETLSKTKAAYQEALADMLKGSHFSLNRVYWVVGALLSLAGVVSLFLSLGEMALTAKSVFTFVVPLVLAGIVGFTAWHERSRGDKGGAVLMGVMALGFGAFGLYGMWQLFREAGWQISASVPVLLAVNAGFYQWMKAPSKEGRRVLDEIEGFREYLSVAEEDRLNAENPPEVTPELFERFLPYALALGVAQQWSEKFARAMKAAGQATKPSGKGGRGDDLLLQPSYYSGDARGVSGLVTGAAVGAALTSVLTTATAAPRSSSGGGDSSSSYDSGSSGGGGGGGGGGGW